MPGPPAIPAAATAAMPALAAATGMATPELGAGSVADAVVFAVEGHLFGLLAGSVDEVIRAVAVSPLPQLGGYVAGVIDVRGVVVAVLDWRRAFALAPRPVATSDFMVLARAGSRRVAIPVDDVVGLLPVPLVSPPPGEAPLAPGIGRAVLAGHVSGALVLIQCLEDFLSAGVCCDLDAALAAGGRAGA